MRSIVIAGVIASGFFGFSPIAHASSNQTLQLYPGHGITLNFRTSGETVHKTWLDDPSQVTLDFDDSNCRMAGNQLCAAQVLHLRRINRLSFPGLPATPTTALTVVTNRNIYRFQLTFPKSGHPTSGVIDVGSRTALASPRKQPTMASIEQGLQTAVARNLLVKGDALWNRIQQLLQLTRRGTPLSQATRQAGVSPEVLQRLTEMGQTTR